MSACEQCWNEAFAIARRTGQHQADVYRVLVRQPRSHPHGLPAQLDGIDANGQQEAQ